MSCIDSIGDDPSPPNNIVFFSIAFAIAVAVVAVVIDVRLEGIRLISRIGPGARIICSISSMMDGFASLRTGNFGFNSAFLFVYGSQLPVFLFLCVPFGHLDCFSTIFSFSNSFSDSFSNSLSNSLSIASFSLSLPNGSTGSISIPAGTMDSLSDSNASSSNFSIGVIYFNTSSKLSIGYTMFNASNGICNKVYPNPSIFSKLGISFITPLFVVIVIFLFLKLSIINLYPMDWYDPILVKYILRILSLSVSSIFFPFI